MPSLCAVAYALAVKKQEKEEKEKMTECIHIDDCECMISEFVYRKACLEGLRSIYCPLHWGTSHRVPRLWREEA